jgi:hypothetical protein
MAQNTTVSFDIADGWTQLTDANITAITFQVRAGGTVLIQATSGATAPTTDEGSLTYKTGQGEATDRSLISSPVCRAPIAFTPRPRDRTPPSS